MTSLSLFTFVHWRRKWHPTPVFLPENPRDGGAWWAAVCGVVQSRTRLKRLSSSSSRPFIFNVVVDKVGFKFDNVGSYRLFSICSIFEFFSRFIYFLCWLIVCSHLFYFCGCFRMFPGGSAGKESACNTEDLGWIPGWKDPLEKGTATHSSILVERIPWTGQSRRVGHD